MANHSPSTLDVPSSAVQIGQILRLKCLPDVTTCHSLSSAEELHIRLEMPLVEYLIIEKLDSDHGAFWAIKVSDYSTKEFDLYNWNYTNYPLHIPLAGSANTCPLSIREALQDNSFLESAKASGQQLLRYGLPLTTMDLPVLHRSMPEEADVWKFLDVTHIYEFSPTMIVSQGTRARYLEPESLEMVKWYAAPKIYQRMLKTRALEPANFSQGRQGMWGQIYWLDANLIDHTLDPISRQIESFFCVLFRRMENSRGEATHAIVCPVSFPHLTWAWAWNQTPSRSKYRNLFSLGTVELTNKSRIAKVEADLGSCYSVPLSALKLIPACSILQQNLDNKAISRMWNIPMDPDSKAVVELKENPPACANNVSASSPYQAIDQLDGMVLNGKLMHDRNMKPRSANEQAWNETLASASAIPQVQTYQPLTPSSLLKYVKSDERAVFIQPERMDVELAFPVRTAEVSSKHESMPPLPTNKQRMQHEQDTKLPVRAMRSAAGVPFPARMERETHTHTVEQLTAETNQKGQNDIGKAMSRSQKERLQADATNQRWQSIVERLEEELDGSKPKMHDAVLNSVRPPRTEKEEKAWQEREKAETDLRNFLRIRKGEMKEEMRANVANPINTMIQLSARMKEEPQANITNHVKQALAGEQETALEEDTKEKTQDNIVDDVRQYMANIQDNAPAHNKSHGFESGWEDGEVSDEAWEML